MMEEALLYFLVKFISVLVSIFILETADVDITVLVISALSFACLFVLELLLNKLVRNKQVIIATNAVALIACFALGMDFYLSLFILCLIHIIDITVNTSMFYYILGVVVLLSIMIFMPSTKAMIMIFILMIILLSGRLFIKRYHKINENNEKQKEIISELNKKITDIKSLNKTMKYNVSIEERNRIAARIHDQVGHGISGSIILLEASLLVMKNNPEKAAETVQKAIINLREGVDEIRASLRDERAERYLIGINDIQAMLEEFKVNYNKAVNLHTDGDLNQISLDIWSCIHDNLKECFINLLKHSNATQFCLNIEIYKKIIKVEYKDNGTSSEHFEKGIGLESIEERTINARGRCFFNKGENGFCITNIFTT